jgi:hypothetical protein
MIKDGQRIQRHDKKTNLRKYRRSEDKEGDNDNNKREPKTTNERQRQQTRDKDNKRETKTTNERQRQQTIDKDNKREKTQKKYTDSIKNRESNEVLLKGNQFPLNVWYMLCY